MRLSARHWALRMPLVMSEGRLEGRTSTPRSLPTSYALRALREREARTGPRASGRLRASGCREMDAQLGGARALLHGAMDHASHAAGAAPSRHGALRRGCAASASAAQHFLGARSSAFW